MPTSISSIAASSLTVRFKEPFLSQGLNTKLLTTPPGIFRGFRLGTSGSALTVTALPDALGDSIATAHNAAGNAVGVRVVGSTSLSLASMVSKTVVIAIYVQYSTTATTAAEFRMYELSPTDEFTSAPEKAQLIVLGTVVVPASGLISANSVTHQHRTYAGNAVPAQALPRVPLVFNPYFALALIDGAALNPQALQTVGWALSPVPGWRVDSLGTATDVWQVVSDPTKLGNRSLQLGVVGGTTIDTWLEQRIYYEMGGLATADDYIDVEFEYEVVTIAPATSTLWLNFQDLTPLTFSKTYVLDTASTGVKTLSRSFRASTILNGITPPEFPLILKNVQLQFSWTGAVSGTTYLRLRKLQVTAPAMQTAVEGGADVDGRALRRMLGDHGASILRILNPRISTDTAPERALDVALALFGSLLPARSGGSALMLGKGDGTGTNESLVVPGSVTSGHGLQDSNLNYALPRFHAKYNSTAGHFTLLWEAESGALAKTTCWVSATGETYMTVNAVWNAGAVGWEKTINGTAASAVKITATGVRILSQLAGTNTWVDSAWDDSGGGEILDPLTSTWADGSSISSTTLWGMLNEVVSDLGSGTSGADRISANVAQTWADSSAIVGTSVDLVLENIITALRGTSGADKVGAAVAQTWADSTAIVGASVDLVLENIITALRGTAGADKVGAAIAQTWADSTAITGASVDAVIENIVTALRGTAGANKVGASVSTTWANGDAVTGASVDAVLEKIVADLKDDTGTSGADRTGVNAAGFSGVLTGFGGSGLTTAYSTLQQTLTAVDAALEARRGFTAVVTDGTNSVGGDINTVTPFSDIQSLDGGTFLFRRGDYQVSETGVGDLDYVLIGEQGSRNVSLTNSGASGVSFSRSSTTGLSSFENIDFIPSAGAFGYFQFGDGTLRIRHCQFKAGGINFYPLSIGLRLQVEGLHIFANDVAVQRDASIRFSSQVNQEATGILRGVRVSHVPSYNNATVAKYALHMVGLVPTAVTSIDALTFENSNFNVTTGFAAGNGAVFRSENSTAPVIFNGCLFRQGMGASAAGVLEIDGASNLTFNDCTFEQAGIGKVLSIIGATTNNIKFKNCRFYTSSSAALSQEFYVACGAVDAPPVVFENCAVYLRTSSTSVAYRMEFNSLNGANVSSAKGSLSVDGLKVHLAFTGGAISPRFFYVNSTTSSYGAVLSFKNLSFYLNSNTLRVASEYAIVFSTGSTPCFIEDLNIHGVKEPVAPATTDTCYLVYLINAHVLNGAVHGDSTVGGLAWRAVFDLNTEATLTKFLFHANNNVVRGRCVRITGNYVVVHACKALVASIHASESASGWFCSITDDMAHCEVTDNKIAMTAGVGALESLTSSLAIINMGSSSAFGYGHHVVSGNSFTVATEVAFVLSNARYSRVADNTYDQIAEGTVGAPVTIHLNGGDHNQLFGNLLHKRVGVAPLITYGTQTGTIPIAANIDTYNTRF